MYQCDHDLNQSSLTAKVGEKISVFLQSTLGTSANHIKNLLFYSFRQRRLISLLADPA